MTGRITPKEEINLKFSKREEIEESIIELQKFLDALKDLVPTIENTSSPVFKEDLRELADKYIHLISVHTAHIQRMIQGL